ncbi:SH3 domain-containing protein 19 isoform X2 [Bombyx mori]|uniref:SH3 domain-containing protein n=1 Tax=Bombyx mori TaxID=7091 RepID=A0A8R2QZ94_BOMMO|nr:SH3 domain-containing protein 19 isoform X2 [Bombyx mori]
MFTLMRMKGPTRPAPNVPVNGVHRYCPTTNWDNDPFGDVFEPTPHVQKKKPPPRPPPPRVISKQPDIPAKPSHFIRKPNVLSSLLSRKNRPVNNQNIKLQGIVSDFECELDSNKMFPKCEPKNIQTGALIDLSSPPSSPTFTTRSSSDGLSVDSFGSDATTSTSHQNALNGNSSQAESGFEDDFDLFMNTRKNDTVDDMTVIDPFSPQPAKPLIMKKPMLMKDPFDLTSINLHAQVPSLKGPTIIRAKPARPKPPDNVVLLKNSLGDNFSVTKMNVNMTKPLQKVNQYSDNYDTKLNWEENDVESEDREGSPPMPTIPPPPPPLLSDEPTPWTDSMNFEELISEDDPYAIALFDYFTDHPDDLCFSANTRIKLIRRVDHEWLFGQLKSGVEGIFPSNYVEIKVPLPNDAASPRPSIGTAIALYNFESNEVGDLPFVPGDSITVLEKLNDEWYYGECNGKKGQFPVNYVQMS